MNGYRVDFGELEDLYKKFWLLQPSVDDFSRRTAALHPAPTDFPEAAADFAIRINQRSKEAGTLASLLSAGHRNATQKVSATGYRYGSAEAENDRKIRDEGELLADHSDPGSGPPYAARIFAGAVPVSSALSSLAGYMRAARLARSPVFMGLSTFSALSALSVNIYATTILLRNLRDPGVWEDRGSEAAGLKDDLSGHADVVHHAVNASYDYLEGETGDAFRTSVTSQLEGPTRVLAEALGEIADSSSDAAEAQRKFNNTIAFMAPICASLMSYVGYVYPPAELALAAAWLLFVTARRDELRASLDQAAAQLGPGGEVAAAGERLRRGLGASGESPSPAV
ncbi:hypothetical protein GCM10027176_09440 [Actinoallomurus bryophytorum]|uniref:Uncharacterized protein n=1 Tax=Actinoallomurus bryophytorum TaxID=1490222 RepID=A0A543BZN2_9ACTN|nr:hypothetical protein [Actinoallomurus bryophytorum]TQL90281.1 hypothetical protein FB559_7582 [Actinoallomurus bryophytorum]